MPSAEYRSAEKSAISPIMFWLQIGFNCANQKLSHLYLGKLECIAPKESGGQFTVVQGAAKISASVKNYQQLMGMFFY